MLQAKRREKDNHTQVVLCEYEGKYVTWVYNAQLPSVFWGHYYTQLPHAEEDFAERT